MGAIDGRQGADDLDTDPPIPTAHIMDWEPIQEAPPPIPVEIELEYTPQAGDNVIQIPHTPDDLDLNPPEPRQTTFDSEPVRYADPPEPREITFDTEPVHREPVEERVVIHDYEVVRFDSSESASDHAPMVHELRDDDGYDSFQAAHDVTHEPTDALPDDDSADPPQSAHVDDASDG